MYLNIHTHTARNSWEIQSLFPEERLDFPSFSVGIHPKFITENYENQWAQVVEKSQSEACFFIGECGLDKTSQADFSLQEILFRRHILLSETRKKPMIIHCVRSFYEVISIKKSTQPKQNWVLHGFIKNEKVAQDLLQNGIKLSFGEAILYSERLQGILKNLKESDFFLETDASSHTIEEIYAKVATLRAISVTELQEIQRLNFNQLGIKSFCKMGV